MTGRQAVPCSAADQAELVRALSRPGALGQGSGPTRLLETHISYVLLSGRYAYKIKKAVNLGFLDFTSLAQRQHFCAEELRLNRRLAPRRYLSLVSIGGSPAAPCLNDDGWAIEYAVKMRRFSQSALLDRRLAKQGISPEQIDDLADQVAAFHGQIPHAAPDGAAGSPESVWDPMAENFRQLRAALPAAEFATQLDELAAWSRQRFNQLHQLILARRQQGWVRECHGDLHLGNIALIKGRPEIFDCIEFSPALRWIDVVSDLAFLVMDLAQRGRVDFSRRLLNRYLESSGDYGALPLLDFYQVYRALVRAKVAAIRAAQDSRASWSDCAAYLDHGSQLCRPGRPSLILMHGVSGSGKSWLSQALLESSGAIRLRSDVERKRLYGSTAQLYSAEAGRATYQHLAQLARNLLGAGFAVVVDAASLQFWQRRLFSDLADELALPFWLLACQAPDAQLRQRLLARQQAGKDASDADIAVMTRQQLALVPITPAEQGRCLHLDTAQCSRDELLRRIAAVWPPAA